MKYQQSHSARIFPTMGLYIICIDIPDAEWCWGANKVVTMLPDQRLPWSPPLSRQICGPGTEPTERTRVPEVPCCF